MPRVLRERLGLTAELHPGEAAFLAVTVAANDLRIVVEDHLESHGLTQLEFTVLTILQSAGCDGCRLAKVADTLGVRSREMSGVARRVEEEGWASKARYPGDRRYTVHRIEPAGRAKLRTVKALEDPYDRVCRALGADGVEDVVTVCDRLGRAARWLDGITLPRLRARGLTRTQYLVLKMLSAAGPEGLRSAAIRDSLLTASPDLRRLLQKLRQWGWTEMNPGEDDAREIFHRITDDGHEKLAELEYVMDEAHESIQRELGDGKVGEVVSLCQDVIRASHRLRVRSAGNGAIPY